MDFETKRELLKWTDSYWDLLPAEMKEIILKYKESQELIDRRESASNRALCRQIECTSCCDKGGKWAMFSVNLYIVILVWL